MQTGTTPSGKIMLATPCFGGMVTTGYMLSVIGYASSGQSIPMTVMHVGDDALITAPPSRFTHQHQAADGPNHHQRPRLWAIPTRTDGMPEKEAVPV